MACNGKSKELAKLGSTIGVPFKVQEVVAAFAQVYAGLSGDFFCAYPESVVQEAVALPSLNELR